MYSSLYIHVPFCHGKCDYCAFYSLPDASPALHRQYLSRIREELQAGAPECAPLRSIFIGGGTPSTLAPDEWRALADSIAGSFALAPECEWSVEANPESLTPELIDAWAAAGVNRVSIGVQAFQEHLRQIIGRRGSLAGLPEAARALRAVGIRDLNLDLIFNLPGQTREDWRASLRRALEFEPTHLSAYALTLEEGTRLASSLPPLSDEQFLEFWHDTDELLATAGIHRYEISNFVAPGPQCLHNYRIWKGATYLGCGPAAASFDGVDRRANPSSLDAWLHHTPPELDHIHPDARAAEILVTGLRTLDGWSWSEFQQATGHDARRLRGPQLEKLRRLGLLAVSDDGTRPTPQGLLFHDDIALELL